MKKSFLAILSLVLVALTIGTSVAVFAEEAVSNRTTVVLKASEDDGKYYVDLQGKDDVLNKVPGEFNSPKYGEDYVDENNIPRLTDGVYAIEPLKDLYGISYFNLAWCANGEAEQFETDGGAFEYKLTSGETAKYLYTFEWTGLDCEASSFALWFNNETAYYDYDTNDAYSWWQQDSEFCILVSQDGGKTYTEVYHSVPFTVENDAIVSCASWLKSEGGLWEMFDAIDNDKASLFRYRYMTAEFDMNYKGVTNIVYAGIKARRNGNSKVTAFYYSPRIAEFDVYGKTITPKFVETEPETTVEETTAAPEVTTAAPVVTTAAPAVTTAAPAETKAPETEAPATEAPATQAPETEAPAKTGCGATVSVIGVAAVMILGSAFIRKKD